MGAAEPPAPGWRGVERGALDRAGFSLVLAVSLLGLSAATCSGQLSGRPASFAKSPHKSAAPAPALSASLAQAVAPKPPAVASAIGPPIPSEPLARFRARLAAKAEPSTQPTRIVWFGDSHTAADFWPNAVRRVLAVKLPLAGPGYLPLGLTGYRHGHARVFSEGFEVAPHPPSRRSREGDGVFGLAGFRARPKDVASSVTIRLDASPELAQPFAGRLSYRWSSELDGLDVVVSEQRHRLRAAAGFVTTPQHFDFNVPKDALIEVRGVGGHPDLFGVVVETPGRGLVLDSLGINGARFATALAWDETTWSALLAERAPALLVFAYGTNEVFDDTPLAKVGETISALIARARRAAPDADCLLAGPTDVGRGGKAAEDRVRELDTLERVTAAQLGCAYFSPYELMGGETGFDDWSNAKPLLAQNDRIHLTAAGYAKLGEGLAALLLAAPPASSPAQ